MTSEKAALARSPQEVTELFATRMSAGDVDGALELYEATSSFAPEPHTEVMGLMSIRTALEDFVALKPDTSGAVYWIQRAGDIALVLNSWKLDGTLPDGEPVHMTGRSADVMRLGSDGGWRFVIDCPWIAEVAAETGGDAK